MEAIADSSGSKIVDSPAAFFLHQSGLREEQLRTMKSSFRFANVCGTVYQQGNIQFTGNGDCLYSPVGNRLSVFDLVRNVSFRFLSKLENLLRASPFHRQTLA